MDQRVEEYSTTFDFNIFISTLSAYAISGALCLAMAELFRNLQTIVNLLCRKE